MSECCLNYIPEGFRNSPREWEAFKEQAARKGLEIHNPWRSGPHGGQGVRETPRNSPANSTNTEGPFPVPSRVGGGPEKRGDLSVWHGTSKGGRPSSGLTESEKRAKDRERKRKQRRAHG